MQAIAEFGPPLEVVSSCLRGAFQAPKGQKLVVADLGSIETRVLGWLTRCDTLSNVFRDGLDVYKAFASFMYGVPYDEVTKLQRQVAKSAILGCGYQMSGGELKRDCCWGKVTPWNDTDEDVCRCAIPGDEVKTGLWGYADNMGIAMEQSVARAAVDAYRERYKEVVEFWYNIEDAFIEAVLTGKVAQSYGLTIGVVPDKVLWVILPSGRRLHYLNPKLGPGKFKRPSLTHYTHGLKGWVREQLYGGLITENLVQAIARDVLAEGMMRADAAGLEIVLHTHDEIGCLERVTHEDALKTLIDCMSRPMPWASDLILAAEGYESQVYKK